jgi:curved DNA-binding protein CbpA
MGANGYRDYFKVLDLDRGADADAVKRSFRKLARQYHPDVNPGDKTAEAKFKEISEAYEVLSDPDKRRRYEQFGQYWNQAGGAAGGVDVDFGRYGNFDDFINDLLGRFGGPGGVGGMGGGGMGGGGMGGGGMGGGGMGGMCWVAREVYGNDNPKWLLFRDWLQNQAPRWLHDAYAAHGEAFAVWIHGKPIVKSALRMLMDQAIASQAPMPCPVSE